MKLTNLLALPLALAADALTFGEAGVTRRIFQDERNDQEIEAVKAMAKVIEAVNKK